MSRVRDEYVSWEGGVMTSPHFDQLPKGTSPRGINSALKSIGVGTAIVQKRLGCVVGNATPIGGTPIIVGQFQFRKANGTNYHVLVGSDGGVYRLDGGAISTLAAAATLATGNEKFPEFAVANDLMFLTNGTDSKKFNGTAVQNFGITKPAAPTATVGLAGVMTGDYDVLVTYYNSATDHESSASVFSSVTLASQQLDVAWVASADTQVSHVRIYIRKRSLNTIFLRVTTGVAAGTYVSAAEGFTGTSAKLNLTDAQIQSLIRPAPTEISNNPPPAGARYCVWHRSRMFVADSGNLYWSQVEKPEAFDTENNVEPINPDDGDEIVGLHAAPDQLLIFKKYRTYALKGTNPATWKVEIVSADTGTVAHNSIITAEGVTYWFAVGKGPVAYSQEGIPIPLGQALIQDTVTPDVLNYAKLNLVHAVDDVDRQRILWAVPETLLSRNTFLIPFNYRLRKFESTAWNPLDVASMTLVEETDGSRFVYLGGYSGQAFKFWTGGNDAASFKGKVTSAGAATLTDSTAAFTTTGGGLVERYVYAISSDGATVQRRRIISNTATQLTVATNWSPVINDTYTYFVGGIDFQWDTPWDYSGIAFNKKRYEFIFVQALTEDADIKVFVDLFVSYDGVTTAKTKNFILGAGAVYAGSVGDGPAYYDISRYASEGVLNVKLRCGKTGNAWRVRVRNLDPDKEVILTKISMQAVVQNEKDMDD